MKYLGIVRRTGALGADSLTGTIELECYAHNGGMILASGEFEAPRSTIALFKRGEKLDFVTQDGHRLSLALSDPKQSPSGTVAQITATGDLPSMKSGSLGWPEQDAGR